MCREVMSAVVSSRRLVQGAGTVALQLIGQDIGMEEACQAAIKPAGGEGVKSARRRGRGASNCRALRFCGRRAAICMRAAAASTNAITASVAAILRSWRSRQ